MKGCGPTGKNKPRACRLCQVTVLHRELLGPRSDTPLWYAIPHLAPCGLRCVAGGVHELELAEARARGLAAGDVVHGWYAEAGAPRRCPRCGLCAGVARAS